MKTSITLLIAFFAFTISAFAQVQSPVTATIQLAKSPSGVGCMQLNWTNGEVNTDYFLVERSFDGVAFKQIALVFAAEDNSIPAYRFNDKEFATGGTEVYYRLARVNTHKEVSYSPVQKMAISTPDQAKLTQPAIDCLASRK